MNKKQLILWSLYDFANSFVFINFLLYFSQWLVVDGGLSDIWYNSIFAITSIILFFTAPVLASFTDRYGGRKYFLNVSTAGTFLGYSLATWGAFYGYNIYFVTLCFLVGQYFYQLSFVFYNTLLEDVSDKAHRNRASGIGQFMNSLGQVSGLIVALPFSATRLQPLVPSLVIFALLSLPMILKFRDSRPKSRDISVTLFEKGEERYFRKMLMFFSTSVAIPVLVSFFFFNDALITISNNYPIYMERVFGVTDTVKNILLMSVLFMSAIGGVVSGWVADRIGPLRALKYILVGWIILIPLIVISDDLISLSILSAISGLLIGSVWTVTRAYLSAVLKKEELSYGFSFYTLFERFATLVGPLAWGGTIAILGTQSSSYRIAMLLMVVFVAAGLILLNKWKR